MSMFTAEISLSYLDFATPVAPQLIGTYVSARTAAVAVEGGYVHSVAGQSPVKGAYVTSLETVDASSSARGTYIS